jgi:hypothetical protein
LTLPRSGGVTCKRFNETETLSFDILSVFDEYPIKSALANYPPSQPNTGKAQEVLPDRALPDQSRR